MGTDGDYYRLVLNMRQAGEDSKAVHYYLADGANPSAEKLTLVALNTIGQIIDNVQAAALAHISFFAENLNDPQNDFYTRPSTNVGVVAGEIMPKFVAWGYKLSVANRTTKAGGKRIPGVPESWVLAGVADPAKYFDLESAGAAWSNVLVDADTVQYIPGVARVTGKLTTGYTVEAFNPITGVTFNGVTTQNTRKR